MLALVGYYYLLIITCNLIDFYHVECFEKIADFSQADFLHRIQPLTRTTWKLRGLKASSVLNGNYLVPGGVERLVLEWKVTRGEWIDKRDGSYDESKNRLDQGFDDLLHKAGSAGYKPQAKPENMERSEYYNLLSSLAPYESDGPDDTEEWNLFDQYLDRTAETLDNPHDLSQMLLRWEIDVVRICPYPLTFVWDMLTSNRCSQRKKKINLVM